MPPVTYNAYSALTQYVQDPPCDYTFNFAAKISVTDPVTGIAELVDLPSWLIFDPNNLTFNMEKCGSDLSVTDPDCSRTPVPGQYNIYIVAYLPETEDANGNNFVADSSASFVIDVVIDCANDYFSFTTINDAVTH